MDHFHGIAIILYEHICDDICDDKVSSARPETKSGIDFAVPGFVVQRVIQSTSAAPRFF